MRKFIPVALDYIRLSRKRNKSANFLLDERPDIGDELLIREDTAGLAYYQTIKVV